MNIFAFHAEMMRFHHVAFASLYGVNLTLRLNVDKLLDN